MGVVWRALDTALDREVAIKILPDAFASDPDRLSRFEREAKVLASFSHPNIAAIYGLHHEGGVHFLAMELIRGTPLTQAIARGLDVARVVELAIAMADGLAAAHRQHVTHRDLKPDNVMVDLDGRPKILDFGLAKLDAPAAPPDATTVLGATSVTQHGTVSGTVPYMSPEQAEGRRVDRRSDVFSFGTMLYEMVTGRRPFAGDTPMATLTSILRDTPTPIAQASPSTPAALDRIVTRCLEKNPDARYPDASSLRDALRLLGPASAAGRLPPAAAQRTRWMAVLAVGAFGLATLIAWSMFRVDRTDEPPPLQAVPLTSDVGDEESPSFSPDGNQITYSWNGEGQDNYDIYVRLIGSAKPLRLTTDPARDVRPAFSPDGRSIGFVRVAKGRWTYMVISAMGGSERAVADLPRREDGPLTPFAVDWSSAWLPDGRNVLLDGLRLLSLDTGHVTDLTDSVGRHVTGWYPAIAPDGKTLAFARPASGYASVSLYLADLSSDGRLRGDPRPLAQLDGDVIGLAWTSDGREVAFAGGPISGSSGIYKRLSRVEARPGGRPQVLPLGADLTFPAIARSGGRLAFVRNTLDVNLWRAPLQDGGLADAAPSRFAPSTRIDGNAQYSPDGHRVAFESNRTGDGGIWVAASDGSNAEEVFSRPGRHAGTPRWAPDSRRLAFDSTAEGTYDIFVLELGSSRPLRLTTEASDDAIPSWSPDGAWIYFASNRTGRQEVWKVPSGGGPAEQVTRNGGACVFPSADGTRIYYTKHDGDAALWTRPVAGGAEQQVLPSVNNRGFVVFDDRIYFRSHATAEGQFALYSLDLTTRAVQLVTPLKAGNGLGLAVSPDRRHVLYSEADQLGRDLVLVNGFR